MEVSGAGSIGFTVMRHAFGRAGGRALEALEGPFPKGLRPVCAAVKDGGGGGGPNSRRPVRCNGGAGKLMMARGRKNLLTFGNSPVWCAIFRRGQGELSGEFAHSKRISAAAGSVDGGCRRRPARG